MVSSAENNEMMTWLVVEDDPPIREVIEAACDLWNFQVISLKDGFQAMEYLDQDPLPEPIPYVALLDIQLPGPWGHEISARIRQHPLLNNIGIVLMTAYELPGPDEKQMLKTSGADRLIYKPLPAMVDLLNLIKGIVQERAANSGQQVESPGSG